MGRGSKEENVMWIATDQIDGILEFYKAINWKEPWLIGLLIFHCLTLLTLIIFRSNMNVQCVMFVCLLGFAVLSETLNELGAKHWRSFAKEQYFDSQGLFMMAVYSGPMLFICFLIMFSWLWQAFNMMVVVGKGRLREKGRLAAKAKEEKKDK